MISEIFTTEVIKLLIALLIGAIIGAEREYKSKAAGFRTVILVTVGSCLFTILSIQLGGVSDQGRIAANIVTGIGFLGAGAIYRDKISIRGLTTATAIWISAALGMAIGCGEYHMAFIVTGIVMVILLSFSWFQKIIDTVNQEKNYKIKFENSIFKINHIENLFIKFNLESTRIKQERNGEEITVIFSVEGKEKNHEVFTEALFMEDSIKGFEV
ncbi:MAG TPA: MgtC/SapB family protein [Cytophagaceae bacterium]|jgi:putative Mg2+ transporter-C (MgtC) family protein|nr:MgtC/SapB family protein [Cytophagaceae bacterium]